MPLRFVSPAPARIRIRANRPQGFRRAGLFHPAEWTEHDAGRFSYGEVSALLDEPNLTVELIYGE